MTEAVGHGFASVCATPLRLRSEVIGALSLFSTQVGHFSEADQRVARALAATSTIGILSDRAIRRGTGLAEQLQAALHSRIMIEQAQGLLAHAGDLPIDETFTVLRAYGRAHSTRLSEIAYHLITGALSPTVVLDHTDVAGPSASYLRFPHPSPAAEP